MKSSRLAPVSAKVVAAILDWQFPRCETFLGLATLRAKFYSSDMASGAQIKALLKSHAEGDDTQFYAIALQVAAAEARKGHADVAKELRDLVENSRKRESRHEARENILHIAQPDSELSDLLTMTEPTTRLSELVLDEAVLTRIRRILSEQHHLDRLKSHALRPRQSLL